MSAAFRQGANRLIGRAGRDASRAFVTGCFDTHLTHDLRGLSPEELKVCQPVSMDDGSAKADSSRLNTGNPSSQSTKTIPKSVSS